MSTEHSQLTGAALHEPKGIATADEFKVYVADGAASGDWSLISADSLEGPAKAFQGQLLHVRDEKASNTDGGSFTTGDWRQRVLNTIVGVNEITGSSLSANRITLPAGDYFIRATAPALLVNAHKARLYNITDASVILYGTSEHCSSGASIGNSSIISGRFTLAAEKVVEVQHRCSATFASIGFGTAGNFFITGTSGAKVNEVYTEVLLWKVG